MGRRRLCGRKPTKERQAPLCGARDCNKPAARNAQNTGWNKYCGAACAQEENRRMATRSAKCDKALCDYGMRPVDEWRQCPVCRDFFPARLHGTDFRCEVVTCSPWTGSRCAKDISRKESEKVSLQEQEEVAAKVAAYREKLIAEYGEIPAVAVKEKRRESTQSRRWCIVNGRDCIDYITKCLTDDGWFPQCVRGANYRSK